MEATATTIPSLIYRDAQGRARIQGTRFKVIQVARSCRAGLHADAIQEAYPQLTLAQIHAALSYYYAHQEEMDAQLEREDHEVAAFIASQPNPVSREELVQRLDRDE
jgi:uncharacterized protein (DUF433 family)